MMQLFCSNEDMSSETLKDSLTDVYLASNDSIDASPPYRSRCNTWPRLVRGLNSGVDSAEVPSAEDSWGGGSLLPLVSEETDELSEGDTPNNPLIKEKYPQSGALETPQSVELTSPSAPAFLSHSTTGAAAPSSVSTRRNPWGNCSYADLITQAIQSSTDQRLTVSQIYEWLVKNITFFADKGDSNSSAGWKNSIRHNLSLHPKFVRVQNEGTGKSSWWIINPDVKPGVKPSRRRAMSMETSSARQRKNNLSRGKRRNISGDHHHHHNTLHSSSQLERTLSSGSLPPYDYSGDIHSDHFRPRASSSASSCGGLPGSPLTISSSSTDFLCSKASVAPTWASNNNSYNGNSLSPTLFNVVERLNLQDSMDDGSSATVSGTSGDNLDNITLNDLNLDYETSKLLDSLLSPDEPTTKSEKELIPTAQQKIKILEQRDSTSRGSSMSTSSPSSPPGLTSSYPCSFVPQPKIEEDLTSQESPYYLCRDSDMMETNFSSGEEHHAPSVLSSQQTPLYSEQFRSFDDVILENNVNSASSYIQGLSLNYLHGPTDHKSVVSSLQSNANTNNNVKKAPPPLTLNSY